MESSSPLSYAFAGALAGGRTTAGPAFVSRKLETRGVAALRAYEAMGPAFARDAEAVGEWMQFNL